MKHSAKSSGYRANQSGILAEDLLVTILKKHGCPVLRQFPIAEGIYGTILNADIYVPPRNGFPQGFAVESKWQEAQGSVDEKLSYLAFNIKERYLCPTIIVADGGGAREGAILWLKAQVDRQKLLAVLDLAGFLRWANCSLESL
jgi:hypothetical protein